MVAGRSTSPARARRRPRAIGPRLRHHPVPGHARAPRPLHAGGHRPPRVRLARQPRASAKGDAGRGRGRTTSPTRPSPQILRARRRPASRASGRRRWTASVPDLSHVGATPTPGSTATSGSRSAPARSTPSPPRATPRGTSSSPTSRPACCSPATTCCRRSPRRSGSSRRTPTSRSATSSPRSPRSARCPTAAASRARRVTGSTHARIDELRRAPRRAARALPGLGARRPETAYAVAGDLPWTRRERRLDDLDVFNAALAIDGDDGAPGPARRAGLITRRRRRDQRLRAGLRPRLAVEPSGRKRGPSGPRSSTLTSLVPSLG